MRSSCPASGRPHRRWTASATPASSTRSVEWIAADRPFLGICLGLQLLFDGSDEDGAQTFGVLPGRTRRGSTTPRRCRTSAGTRSSVAATTRCSTGSSTDADFYFVHSYAGGAGRARPTTSSSPRPSTAAGSSRRSPAATCSASSSTPSGAATTACACSRTSSSLVRAGRPGRAGSASLMLRRRVIPCLDVADGRVVKGTRFVDLVDEGDPPELAERYAREGADELVFLDITAAPERRGTLLDIVERTARRAFIPLTVGGGVRSVDEMRDVLRAGADKVSLNTAAVADPS